jgi:hypothetical protein
MRRSSATRHSSDPAVQELQRRVDALERELGAKRTARPERLLDRSPQLPGGTVGQQGRGLYTIHHEVNTFPQQAHDHFVLLCPRPIELVEAYWVTEEAWSSDPINYSWIRIQERRKADSYDPAKYRELGYISGEPKTAGPHATGDLAPGQVYRFRLSKTPYAAKSSLIVLDGESETIPGVWPEGYVLLSYRYRDNGGA